MRAQLAGATADFISKLCFELVPSLHDEQKEEIIRIGAYIALMRSHVFADYYQGEIVDMDSVEPEIPTRVSKQLGKLAQLLAVIRGHNIVEKADIYTIRRVARDSSDPKRQKIIDVFAKVGLETFMDLNDITGGTRGLYYKTVRNELVKMRVLGILEENDHGHYRPTGDFREYLGALLQ